MYEGWLYRSGSAGGVSSVDPCAREKPTSPTLISTHMDNTILTYMAVTPSGEGRGNGKKTYMGVGGAAREGARGMRDGMKFLAASEQLLLEH